MHRRDFLNSGSGSGSADSHYMHSNSKCNTLMNITDSETLSGDVAESAVSSSSMSSYGDDYNNGYKYTTTKHIGGSASQRSKVIRKLDRISSTISNLEQTNSGQESRAGSSSRDSERSDRRRIMQNGHAINNSRLTTNHPSSSASVPQSPYAAQPQFGASMRQSPRRHSGTQIQMNHQYQQHQSQEHHFRADSVLSHHSSDVGSCNSRTSDRSANSSKCDTKSTMTSDSSDMQTLTQLTNNMEIDDSNKVLKRARNLYDKGEHKKAIKEFKEALPLEMMKKGVDHFDVGEIYTFLGSSFVKIRQYEEALSVLEEALRIHRLYYEVRPLEVARLLEVIAIVHKKRNDLGNAMCAFKETLKIRRKVLGKDHVDVAMAQHNIGSIYLAKGDFKSAVKAYLESTSAIASVEGSKSKTKGHLNAASKLHQLGGLSCGQGDYILSEKAYLGAIKTREQILGLTHLDLSDSLEKLSEVYAKKGELSKANMVLKKAIWIKKQNNVDASRSHRIMESLHQRRESSGKV